VRSHGHEPTQLEVRQRAHRFDEPRDLFGRAARLLGLVTDVDLKQHLYVHRLSRCSRRKRLRQARGIDGVHTGPGALDELDLVALQMTDEPPPKVGQITQRGSFGRELLGIVLTKHPHPDIVRSSNRLLGMRLGDRDELHRPRIATCAFTRALDAFVEAFESTRDVATQGHRSNAP
jgi:hypothetical protein